MLRKLAHRNPQDVAWITLWVAFSVFVCLLISVPLSVRWYLLNATQAQQGILEVIGGTVTAREPRDQGAISVKGSREAGEGLQIQTGADARATLTLFESSTVLLYGETEMAVVRLRRPQFALSGRPDEIRLELRQGLARVSVAGLGGSARLAVVQTPHGEVRLQQGGSYSVQVAPDHTQVIVRYGEATVMGARRGVKLGLGERVNVDSNGDLDDPMPASQSLIVNGNFAKPLDTGWKVTPYADLEGVAPGRAEIVEQGGRSVVEFARMGAEEGVHTEVSIEQELNRDVGDFVSLVLRLDVRLEHQSLTGAGYRSSEFPVMVELKYRDAYGRDLSWFHGFYYRDPPPNWPVRNGEKIPSLIWYPYESGNLIDLLGDVRPVHIYALRIYASGWNYRSMVSEVGLIAE